MAGEPSATGEPGQRALDDPSSGQDDEACLVRAAFDDLDGEAAGRAEGSGEPGTGICLIGEQMGQPGEQPACVADEVRCPVSVLKAVSEEIHLSGGGEFHSLRRCATPSAISTAHPR